MRGKLFTDDFITEGIQDTEPWAELSNEVFAGFVEALKECFKGFELTTELNEASTESELIIPVLRLLGWSAYLPQQTVSVSGRRDVPDILLFQDEDAKSRALAEGTENARYRHGIAVVESKKWQRPLDRSEAGGPHDRGIPAAQMLRYLSRAEVSSDRAIQWGILTNGRHWRLYWQGARSRLEEFLEIDIAALLGMAGTQTDVFTFSPDQQTHFLRVFLLLFHRDAFITQTWDPEGRSFHAVALEENRLWEERVSQNLGDVVFTNVFPQLLNALIASDGQCPTVLDKDYLEEVRQSALTFLYRLLFLLYAEDRNLLPVHDRRYDDYSLRAVRLDIANRIDSRDTFSETAHRYYQHLKDLFRAVGEGDASIGLPPYNGRLFDVHAYPLLERVNVPDKDLVEVLDGLSRHDENGVRKWINYRDLSVQHLGSIYERLLEFDVAADDGGRIEIRPNIFARKGSGSYYTHDDLVNLVIERTLTPLIEERVQAFEVQCQELARKRSPKTARLQKIQAYDPAEQVLNLRVCDPAMGSGHFLVRVVDFLADSVLELISEAEESVDWAPEDQSYRSPLTDRIAEIRAHILADSEKEHWTIDPANLDDRHIVRRIILKRVIHGVDKNPMAVELAKVALWLHTFTVGAPLSFLDHHLRCGDSLFGQRIGDTVEDLQQTGGLFLHSEIVGLNNATQMMHQIAELTDIDIAEVRESSSLFREVEQTLGPLKDLLDFWHSLRWLDLDPSSKKKDLSHQVLRKLLAGGFGNLLQVVSTGKPQDNADTSKEESAALIDLLDMTRRVAERERFLHWEIAFPTVWSDLLHGTPKGGFDVIVGNPPWDRMKLQEVEWFAARRPEIALAGRASDRKKLIADMEKSRDPLWDDYISARDSAETATRVARKGHDYPLLATGDINIYSLFVERATNLIASSGIVGFLTPSGIAGDKSASRFFKSFATTGRLAALLDFENKKVFFPDIHASFKFCVLVLGGSQRTFSDTECAFFLHGVDELEDPDRAFSLSSEDFAAVNPNTGTAPVFRTRRDAEITTKIYNIYPIFMDRTRKEPISIWPVSYVRMFDMTNDSEHFRTGAELEEAGFYPVEGNKWQKGDELYLPLYEGKMVQAYDHRAASIVIHPENIHRPAQPETSTPEQHTDSDYLPQPQYWVPTTEVTDFHGLDWQICFKDVTAPTNIRTMIAAIVPHYGLGNTLPALVPSSLDVVSEYKEFAPVLVANLNAMPFDYLARQKVQGQHLNYYILEQLPLITEDRYQQEIGGQNVGEFIRTQVLNLSYISSDMKGFALDQGFEGEPFSWNPVDRHRITARLDALFFYLYGIGHGDAAYILDQFPIVKEQEEKAYGKYLTKDLVLAYLNAIEAGDLTADIDL